MNFTATPLQRAEARLQTLLLEYRDTAILERVKLYVAKFSGGKKLSEYLSDPEILEADKLRILGSLTSIISSGDFSRLPELPGVDGLKPHVVIIDEPPAPTNGVHQEAVEEDEPEEPLTMAQIRAIARREARAELADVLEKVAKVLRELA